ncbi:fasciclin domain-containing protein [bacterium]|nr:fasciclin domain-containing protein [bacterium]
MNRFITLIAASSLLLMTALATAGDKKAHTGAALTKNAAQQDIVATAISAGSFNTLVSAVQAAGLVETLQGPGPFTVFAPNDAAFAKLPKGTLEALLADKAKLASVLTYHVVSGTVTAADALKLAGKDAATVNGQSFKVTVRDGAVMVDNATVIATDIQCSNGIIHVIDTVILPK